MSAPYGNPPGGYPRAPAGYPQTPAGYPAPMPVQSFGPPMMAGGWPAPGVWTCPFCRYQGAPHIQKKVSTAGWVTFAILFFACIILCWIGLLMKEDVRACPSCGSKVG